VNPTPPLSSAVVDDVRMLAATVKGALVIGNYDATACAAIWEAVKADVEPWLAQTRPLRPPATNDPA